MPQIHIQSEVPVSKILEAFSKQQDHFYICYVVAKLMKDQIEKIPGFQKFSDYYNPDSESVHYGFLLHNYAAAQLCEIVVGYFNLEITDSYPDATTYPTLFSHGSLNFYGGAQCSNYVEWNQQARIKMMESVLTKDPEIGRAHV
jgi:hypothetical protein